MERMCRQESGLFPSPKEISFTCSCPDWAAMCKHVAAVFYGIGARLDQSPELLFALRKVDPSALVAGAGHDLSLGAKRPGSGKVLSDTGLAEMFGIELAEPAGKFHHPGKRGWAWNLSPSHDEEQGGAQGTDAAPRKAGSQPQASRRGVPPETGTRPATSRRRTGC